MRPHSLHKLICLNAGLAMILSLTACPGKTEQKQQLEQKSAQAQLETRRAEHQGLPQATGSQFPSPSASPSAAHDEQVMAVMTKVQGMLESYQYGNHAGSPPDIRSLYARVKDLNGTIQIKNPYSTMEWNEQNPSGQGVVDMYQEGYCIPGLVLYRVLKTTAEGFVSDYEIHGCDSAGQRLAPLLKQGLNAPQPSATAGSPLPAPSASSPTSPL